MIWESLRMSCKRSVVATPRTVPDASPCGMDQVEFSKGLLIAVVLLPLLPLAVSSSACDRHLDLSRVSITTGHGAVSS